VEIRGGNAPIRATQSPGYPEAAPRSPLQPLVGLYSAPPSTRSQALIATHTSSPYTCVHVHVDGRVVAVEARGDEDGDARRCEERRAWGSIHCPSGPDHD